MSIVLHFEIEKGEPIDRYNFSARIKLTDWSKNYLKGKLGDAVKFSNLDGYYDLDPENFNIHYGENYDRNMLHIRDENGRYLTGNILLNNSVFSVEFSSTDGSITNYGFYSARCAAHNLALEEAYKSSSFNDTNKKLLPVTEDILTRLLKNKNELSISEIPLQVQNKIDEAIAMEEKAKKDAEEKLMAEHAELEELIDNGQILLFKVVKGQAIDDIRTAAVLQLRNTDKYITLDPEKYYFGKYDHYEAVEKYYGKQTPSKYLICKECNSDRSMHLDDKYTFFVLNKSPNYDLQSGFYQIYKGAYAYGKYLKDPVAFIDEKLPEKLLNILDDTNEIYEENGAIDNINIGGSNDKMVKSKEETILEHLIKSIKSDNPERTKLIQDCMDALRMNGKIIDKGESDKIILDQLMKSVNSYGAASLVDEKLIKDLMDCLKMNLKIVESRNHHDSDKDVSYEIRENRDDTIVESKNDDLNHLVSNGIVKYQEADKIIKFMQDKDPETLCALIESLEPCGADSTEGKKLIKSFMDYFKKNYEPEFFRSLNNPIEESDSTREQDNSIRVESETIKAEDSIKRAANLIGAQHKVIEHSKKEDQGTKLVGEDEQKVIVTSVINSMEDTSEHPLKINKGDLIDEGKYKVELNVKYNDMLNLYNNTVNKCYNKKEYSYEHVKALYDEITHIPHSNYDKNLIVLQEAYVTDGHLFIQDHNFGAINNVNQMFYQ